MPPSQLAPDALEAALEVQRRLLSSEWEETGPLRVRMALHTGAAEERDGDYFGPPVNRVARLLSAAHGGQVLLSLACSGAGTRSASYGDDSKGPRRASPQGPLPAREGLPAFSS